MRKNMFKKLSLMSAMILASSVLVGYKPVTGDGNPDDWDIDNDQFVYDYADVFDDDEELELQKLCEEKGKKLELDLVVVTSRDLGSKSEEEYADDFYDEGRFGYEGEYGSGVLYLLDLDRGNIYISTSDLGLLYINDNDVETILDAIYEEAHSKYYYDSAKAFIDEVYDIVSSKKSDNDFEKLEKEWIDGGFEEYRDFEAVYSDDIIAANETSMFTSLKNPLVCALIAAVIALIAVLVMSISSKTRMTAGGRTYLKKGSFRILHKYDRFTHTTTTSHKVNTSSGSSGGGGGSSHHSSSGGHSHGGGGRSL